MEWIVERVEDLEPVAKQIIAALGDRRKMVLYGEMGAGKTTFTAAFCAALGIGDETSSPTFSLINRYESANGAIVVHHLDLYRIKSAEEAWDAGVEEVLYDDSYCLVEWPQVIEAILPPNTLQIHIELLPDGQKRKISVL